GRCSAAVQGLNTTRIERGPSPSSTPYPRSGEAIKAPPPRSGKPHQAPLPREAGEGQGGGIPTATSRCRSGKQRRERLRSSEVVALRVINVERQQAFADRLAFDTLRNRLEPHVLCHAHHRADLRFVAIVTRDVSDQRAVDLEAADRPLVQRIERARSGAAI